MIFVSPPSSQVTVDRVRGDLRHDGEDSDQDLPDKRVHSHGIKGESSLLLICPLLDSHFCLRELSLGVFASLEFIRSSKTDL